MSEKWSKLRRSILGRSILRFWGPIRVGDVIYVFFRVFVKVDIFCNFHQKISDFLMIFVFCQFWEGHFWVFLRCFGVVEGLD